MADGLAGSFRPEWTSGSIGSIAFNPEQLYMLIGGPDYLRFLVPESLLPFSYVGEPDTLERLRSRLVFSFQGLGLVDANGVPCPALASLVAPVRDCAFAVADGLMPVVDKGEEEYRSFAAYFGAQSATFTRFAPGQPSKDEFNLVGLGGADGWEDAFAQNSGLSSVFRFAPASLYVRCKDDDEKGMLAGLRDGSADAARALASAHGVDAGLLAGLADGIASGRYRVYPVQGVDYQRTRLEGIAQARDLRVGPQPWVFSFVVPDAGVIMRSVYVPNPDPDLSVWDEHRTLYSYMDIEFVAGGSLLERLSGVPRAEWGVVPGRVAGPHQGKENG
ncbi:hypothetical protein OZX62_07480 [Bifidobacterium sp. ESL0690]|uniref:hypothetical protein n=1 Tax=Bifidobacterium sp. ESL0690 TaxID=2983214 RepID=UPI0023F6CAB1|nr:hypothetical protein [Bifidobacterium sp. ESL0690]WEV46279.1 hypothetical protein OZX62_07480 [Bifidobacterium sp. ESL0690]